MSTSSSSLRKDKTNEVSEKLPGKLEASVHLYCDSERQSHDKGCGISKENLQSLFKTGFTSKPGGLGFELQITNYSSGKEC